MSPDIPQEIGKILHKHLSPLPRFLLSVRFTSKDSTGLSSPISPGQTRSLEQYLPSVPGCDPEHSETSWGNFFFSYYATVNNSQTVVNFQVHQVQNVFSLLNCWEVKVVEKYIEL